MEQKMYVTYEEFTGPWECSQWLTEFGKKRNLSMSILGITEDGGIIRVYHIDYGE